jgi:hypothetical protein
MPENHIGILPVAFESGADIAPSLSRSTSLTRLLKYHGNLSPGGSAWTGLDWTDFIYPGLSLWGYAGYHY